MPKIWSKQYLFAFSGFTDRASFPCGMVCRFQCVVGERCVLFYCFVINLAFALRKNFNFTATVTVCTYCIIVQHFKLGARVRRTLCNVTPGLKHDRLGSTLKQLLHNIWFLPLQWHKTLVSGWTISRTRRLD